MSVELLGIKRIQDGIIRTADDRFVRLIEVVATNMQYKSDEDKDKIADRFVQIFRSSKFDVHMKAISNPMNFGPYIKQLEDNLSQENNEGCRRFIRSEVEYVNDTRNIDAIEPVFVMSVEYRPDYRRAKEESVLFTQAARQLDQYINTIHTFLIQCGNEIRKHDNETKWTMEYLYGILNRFESLSKPMAEHLQDVVDYHVGEYGRKAVSGISTADYIACRNVKFFHNYCVCNGVYYRYLYIRQDTLPERVAAAYMSTFSRLGVFIDCDFDLIRTDARRLQSVLNRKMRLGRIRMNSMGDKSSDNYAEEEEKLDAGAYLKDGLRKKEDLWYASTVITLVSPELEMLDQETESLVSWLSGLKIKAITVTNKAVIDCYKGVLPYNHFPKSITKKSSQNVLTRDLGAWYNLYSSEYNDPNGILIGLTDLGGDSSRKQGSPVIMDFFNTSVFTNANIAIMGSSGGGKTYLLECLGSRFRMNGIKTFIISPDKSLEYKRFCDAMGGTFVSLGPQTSNNINVMEIFDFPVDEDDTINNLVQKSRMLDKIEFLRRWISLYIPEATQGDIDMFDSACTLAYDLYGISEDNSSLNDPEAPEKFRRMPVLSDVCAFLEEMGEEGIDLAKSFQRLTQGSARVYNQQTNVDLDNRLIVFDLEGLKESNQLLTATAYTIIEYIFSYSKMDRSQKTIIIMDEMWQLIGHTAKKDVARQILEIFKVIRGYGGGAIYATQDFSDNDTEVGRGIMAACKTKIILPLAEDEARLATKSLDLTDDEMNYIIGRPRGNAMICIGKNHIPVYVTASPTAHALFTTDRAELSRQKVARKMQQQKTLIQSDIDRDEIKENVFL